MEIKKANFLLFKFTNLVRSRVAGDPKSRENPLDISKIRFSNATEKYFVYRNNSPFLKFRPIAGDIDESRQKCVQNRPKFLNLAPKLKNRYLARQPLYIGFNDKQHH